MKILEWAEQREDRTMYNLLNRTYIDVGVIRAELRKMADLDDEANNIAIALSSPDITNLAEQLYVLNIRRRQRNVSPAEKAMLDQRYLTLSRKIKALLLDVEVHSEK